MAGKPAPARVKVWRDRYYLFFTDHSTGKQYRRTCESLGASNAIQRQELIRQYRAQEHQAAAEVVVHGRRVASPTTIAEDVASYLDDCQRRVSTRLANPEARAGLSPRSFANMQETIGHFTGWLTAQGHTRLKSRDLNAGLLTSYVDLVIREETRLGNRRKKRSAATINLYTRNLKACLRWIKRMSPRRFAEFDELLQPLKPLRMNPKQRRPYSPDTLARFLAAALERESRDRTTTVHPKRGTRRRRAYGQPSFSTAATPVSRLFLLLALTGIRRADALALKWESVDLERGRITIDAARKTGVRQIVPLNGAPEGQIAPKFVELLKLWKGKAVKVTEDGQRPSDDATVSHRSVADPVYVLPISGCDTPAFPKSAWQETNRLAGVERIGPQGLRQNFTSYAASLGIPSSVSAMWQGHSAEVAERNYRSLALDRKQNATSMEEAMGLDDILDQLIQNGAKAPGGPG